ncbi:DUF418 domain-containing protein [Glycomyces luteolus]|uniref:DUF418 domain-containing protein n=1 Tax=Glycomyces luteolus TaxID=2670330 RepID=A0A9X3PBE4_9ACTN|nr:DUF418 domain-containing protein [Glycomyces luteolus]MDA1362241.1 DUF418 domain-containing protein [Glycomyces luteolus]
MSTPLRERSLAPDLARGLMLLLIALAHAHMFLAHHTTGFRGYAVDGSALDRIVAGLQVVFVDGRALPMFAALFGYGLARLAERRMRAGVEAPQAKRFVRRRSAWLLAFGFAHALLLFFGDILAAYGLIGLVFTGLLWSRDRTLIHTAWITAAAHVLVVAALGASAEAAGHANASPTLVADPFEAAAMRLAVWSALTTTFYVVSVLPAFALGIWAARRDLLGEPSRHLPLLRRTALWGIAIGAAGGLPLMLVDTQLWHPDSVAAVTMYAVHSVTGLASGFGYAALIAVICTRLAETGPSATRPGRGGGPVANALAACGQRSLTCYLLQSIAFTAIFTPMAGNLGAHLGDAAASGIAVLIWLVTVALAAWMAKAGMRGPFEVLLRRLTYGRS